MTPAGTSTSLTSRINEKKIHTQGYHKPVGGMLPDSLFSFIKENFLCSADHKQRDWPLCLENSFFRLAAN